MIIVDVLDPALTALGYAVGRAHDTDAGHDLAAAHRAYELRPRHNLIIPCGIKLAIPPGRFGRVVMRRGHGVPRDCSRRSGAATATVRMIDPPPPARTWAR